MRRQQGWAGGPIWAVIFAVAAIGGWVMYYIESQATSAAREELTQRQAALEERLQSARETTEEFRQRLEQAERGTGEAKALRQRVERLETERERLREALETSRGERRTLQERLAAAQNERDRLQSELRERGRQEARLKDELGSLIDRRQALQERLDSPDAGAPAPGGREALQRQLTEAGREVTEKRGELAAARERIEAIRAEAKTAASEVERLQAEVERLKAEKARQAREFERLQKALKEELASQEVRIEALQKGRAVIEVDARVLFDSGSAWIQPRGERVLQQIGQLLNAFPDRPIRVAGHTDTMPIGPNLADRYPSNWELSTARASAAVRYLEWAAGVDPERMAATGYAENRPVASNDRREGRARNRRIEIQLLPAEAGQPVRVVKPDAR